MFLAPAITVPESRRSKVMAVMDADTGAVAITMPIGTGVDTAVFDSESKPGLFFRTATAG
jgi:hypothetical protein